MPVPLSHRHVLSGMWFLESHPCPAPWAVPSRCGFEPTHGPNVARRSPFVAPAKLVQTTVVGLGSAGSHHGLLGSAQYSSVSLFSTCTMNLGDTQPHTWPKGVDYPKVVDKGHRTGTSLREIVRRGTLVVPGEEGWGINRCSSDPTSGSLRYADLTSRSLRYRSEAHACRARLARRAASRNHLQELAPRPRDAACAGLHARCEGAGSRNFEKRAYLNFAGGSSCTVATPSSSISRRAWRGGRSSSGSLSFPSPNMA